MLKILAETDLISIESPMLVLCIHPDDFNRFKDNLEEVLYYDDLHVQVRARRKLEVERLDPHHLALLEAYQTHGHIPYFNDIERWHLDVEKIYNSCSFLIKKKNRTIAGYV